MRRKDDRVAPKFMYQMMEGIPVTVHTPGVQTRTLCYIQDAMVGFLKTLLVGKNGEVYNIGVQDGEISMKDLAYLMKKEFHPQAVIQEVEMPTEYPQDQAQRRCPDITKAKVELNYIPEISLLEGLRRMWRWCSIQFASEKVEKALEKEVDQRKNLDNVGLDISVSIDDGANTLKAETEGQ